MDTLMAPLLLAKILNPRKSSLGRRNKTHFSGALRGLNFWPNYPWFAARFSLRQQRRKIRLANRVRQGWRLWLAKEALALVPNPLLVSASGKFWTWRMLCRQARNHRCVLCCSQVFRRTRKYSQGRFDTIWHEPTHQSNWWLLLRTVSCHGN